MKKLALALMLATAPAIAAPTLKAPIASMGQLQVDVMAPYDESANADAQFTAAMAKAKASHKRLLIDLGGNWCGDCIILANFMRLPGVARFVQDHYVAMAVDVGRFNKNLQIPARFGITKRLDGVPALLIVTPDGKLVNGSDVFATSDARNMQPQAVADYLAKYAS